MKRLLLTAILAAPFCLAQAPPAATAEVVRLDPGLDAIVSPTAVIEKVVTGFKYLEAPLWRPSGVLWFSDLSGDILYQWSPTDGKATEILNPGGHDPGKPPQGRYPGPNGLVNGPNHAVILCQHGDRRIVSLTADLKMTTLVDRYQGQRVNSPNDLVYAPDGSLYFTDPTFGLAKGNDDPEKELKFNGVFRYAKGKLEALLTDLPMPNGIGFSPDYKTLYVSSSQGNTRTLIQCDVAAAGTVSNCRPFADLSSSPERGVPDGMKIDSLGNVYSAGPGGIWVFSPDGKHLGTLRTPEKPSNCAWGDDGKTLYITAATSVYRIRLKVAGEKALYD